MVLDNIKLQTTWNDAAGSINSNFVKIQMAIASLEGGSGGLNEDELLAFLVENGYITTDDLSNYYTKYEVNELIDEIKAGDIDLANYYTKEEIDRKGFLTSASLVGYAKTTDVANTYATKTALATVDNRLVSIESYFATSEDAGNQIDKWNEIVAFLNATEGTTLSGILAAYYSKTEIDGKITTINAEIAKRALQSDFTALVTRVGTAEGNITSLTNGKADRSELSKYVLLEKASQTIKGDITIEGNLIITGDVASGGEGGNTSAEGTVTGVTVSGVDYTSVEAGLLDLTDLMALYALKSASTKVSVSPSLSSGKSIGVISVDGVGTTLYAPATYAWSEISDVMSTSEFNFIPDGFSGNVNINYRTIDKKATGSISNYLFRDGSNGGGYASLRAKSFIVHGGTSSQFLKADGSVDSNAYVLAKAIGAMDANTIYDASMLSLERGSNLPSYSGFGSLLTMPYRKMTGNTKPDFAAQIFIPNGDDTKPYLYYRTSLGNSWNAWRTVLDDGNYSSYALPLTGGTISGRLSLSFALTSPSQGMIYIKTGDDTKYPTVHFGGNISWGSFGFTAANTPTYFDNSFNPYTLLHSGNYSQYALKKGAETYRLNIETPLTSNDADIYAYFQRISADGTNVSASDIGSARKGVLRLAGGGSESQLLFDHYNSALYYRNYQTSSWSDWKTIAFTDSDITGNAASAYKLIASDGTDAVTIGTKHVNFHKRILLNGYDQINGSEGIVLNWECGKKVSTTICDGQYGKIAIFNSSGGVTIGASDLAGTDVKLYVDGTGRFTGDVIINGNTAIHSGNIGSYNAGSADILAKTYANEDINYPIKQSKLKLICTPDNSGTTYNYPTSYCSGLSVMTSYTGWQIVAYGGTYEPNPFFRKCTDSGTWLAWKRLAFLDDNVASATKLQTARTIWGQSFDGTKDVEGDLNIKWSKIYWNADTNNYYIGYNSSEYAFDFVNYYGHRFYSKGSERMRITADGNILIGDTTDNGSGAKLQVNGAINITDNYKIGGLDVLRVRTDHLAIGEETAYYSSLPTKIYGTRITLQYGKDKICGLFLNSSGNVTIGDSDLAGTSAKLYVDGIIRTTGNIYTTGELFLNHNKSIRMKGGDGVSYNVLFKSSSDLIIGYDSPVIRFGYTKMLINSSGNVGIGTTDPQYTLDVAGTGRFTGAVTMASTLSVTGTLSAKGSIEVYGSTPYIDFHFGNDTADYTSRIIEIASGNLAVYANWLPNTNNAKKLGNSDRRWSEIFGVNGDFSNALTVSGLLTANSGATITGDVTINGNLVVSGDVASGGTGQDTPSEGGTSTSGVLTLTGEIPEGSNIPQSSLDAIGLTDRVIADLLTGKYHHVLYTSGITTYCFVVSGQYNRDYKAFTLHWGDNYMDEFMGYTFSLGPSGGWDIRIYEI